MKSEEELTWIEFDAREILSRQSSRNANTIVELVEEIRRLKNESKVGEARKLLEWVDADSRDREFTAGEWQDRVMKWLNSNDF